MTKLPTKLRLFADFVKRGSLLYNSQMCLSWWQTHRKRSSSSIIPLNSPVPWSIFKLISFGFLTCKLCSRHPCFQTTTTTKKTLSLSWHLPDMATPTRVIMLICWHPFTVLETTCDCSKIKCCICAETDWLCPWSNVHKGVMQKTYYVVSKNKCRQ